MATGFDGIEWVERQSAFQDAEHCRFVDEDFRGHSLDTLSTWRVQNTGGRGSHSIKDDDANGILAMLTGATIADEFILDMYNKRQVDPSLYPVLLIRAKVLDITNVEMQLGLVDVRAVDHCIFKVDVSVTGLDIYAEAYAAGGQTHTVDTTINLDANYHYYGIYIDAAGKPYWYIDGTLRVTGDNADIDPTEFFQPYVEITTEEALLKTIEVDFIKGWQRRE